MSKIFTIVAVTAGLFLFNAPVQARSNCAYAISKLQAQIKFQSGSMDTTAASAAASQAATFDAAAEASKAKGAAADAAANDAACRKAVLAGWNVLNGG
jgi:hypothetical protein